MTSHGDDQLLERLGAALAPPAAEPSAAEVAAFQRVIAGHDDPLATVTAMTAHPRRALGWRLGLVAAAALVLLVAVVANRPGDDPPSVELARARTSLQELSSAIDQGDPVAVLRALSDFERRVAALDPAERAQLEPEAARLREQARELLPPLPPVPTTIATDATPGSSTIPSFPAQLPPTTVDDKGGQRDRSGSNSGQG